LSELNATLDEKVVKVNDKSLNLNKMQMMEWIIAQKPATLYIRALWKLITPPSRWKLPATFNWFYMEFFRTQWTNL